MGINIKYEYPDSWQITVDDYAEVIDHAVLKSCLPFFYSRLGPHIGSRIRNWYRKEILGPSRAQLPPFQSNPDIFGVGERVHREGMFAMMAYPAESARDASQYSYMRDKMQANIFRNYYEKNCRNEDGKEWNMLHTKGMRLSQAYAMHAVGPVALLFTQPHLDGRSMSRNTSWGACEFPCLTRNKSIQKIYQVDLEKPLFDKQGKLSPRLIWSRPDGDGPTEHEPLGHLYAFGEYRDRVFEPCPLLDSVLEERARRKKKDDPLSGGGFEVSMQPSTANFTITSKTVTLHAPPPSNTATAPETHANTVKLRAAVTSNTTNADMADDNSVTCTVRDTSNAAAHTMTKPLISVPSATKPDAPKAPDPPVSAPTPVPAVTKPPTPKTPTSQLTASPQPQPNGHPNRIICKLMRALQRFLRIKPKKQRK